MKKSVKIILIAVLIVLIAIVGYLFNVKYGEDASKKAMVNVEKSIDENKDSSKKSGEEEFIKLDELKKINKDVAGLIKVDGTNIYYPVMQSSDNKDYLRKNINGNYDLNGSIFIDYECRLGKSDNTIIYGHNMDNENMFSDLVKYNDKEFYEKHRSISLYGDGKEQKYRVIGVYNLDITKRSTYDFNIYVKNDGRTDPVKYIENLKKHTVYYDNTADINENTKFLTLATCTDTAGDFRTVVVAVREN